MMRDMETGREIYVDPQAARNDYRRRFEAHEAQLIDICHRRSARLITVTIDQPLDVALLELISNSGSLSAAAGLPKSTRGRAGRGMQQRTDEMLAARSS